MPTCGITNCINGSGDHVVCTSCCTAAASRSWTAPLRFEHEGTGTVDAEIMVDEDRNMKPAP
ncbi:uncharacterized protein RSE6_03268 [Rhynchosporium secalis]|uniref:Uncharacterized protein n=1 Tax=Rhynchosporium secalis TaxID=38038 RepID=A0A1E1M2C1_RHYSE|nr:uncharacterized protein RSE6_03268 [Rhynchosporium secalis]